MFVELVDWASAVVAAVAAMVAAVVVDEAAAAAEADEDSSPPLSLESRLVLRLVLPLNAAAASLALFAAAIALVC